MINIKIGLTYLVTLVLNAGCLAKPAQSILNVKDFGAIENHDASEAINNAIYVASKNKTNGTKVLIDGNYFIKVKNSSFKGAIELRSNVHLIIDGSLKVIPNNYTDYVAIYGQEISNVKITGKGQLIGDRFEHIGNKGEWGAGIRFQSVNDFLIDGITIKDFWGDGITISGNISQDPSLRKPSKGGLIQNVLSTNNRRQGISIIDVDGLKVINSTFSNTNGTLPMAGLDIEPNNYQSVKNVSIESCQFINNKEQAIAILALNKGNIVENVTVSNSKIDGRIQISGSQKLSSGPRNIHLIGNNLNMKSQKNPSIGITNFSSDVLISNNIIENHLSLSSIILITQHSNRVKVQDNNIIGNKLADGIKVSQNSNSSKIVNNRFLKNKTGIVITSNSEVIGNIISETATGGIFIYGDNNLLSKNQLKDLLGGIRIEGKGNKVVDNIISNSLFTKSNKSSSIYIAKGSKFNVINGNKISIDNNKKLDFGIFDESGSNNNRVLNNNFNGNILLKLNHNSNSVNR